MSDVIDTKSTLFKLYLARRLRKSRAWDVEDVLEMDANQVNICSFARNVALEVGLHVMKTLGLIFLGVVAGILLMVPIATGVLWLIFNDGGPLIIFMGGFGFGVLMFDAIIVAFCALGGIIYWFDNSNIVSTAKADVITMTTTSFIAMWIKSIHGKFCIKLNFDRETTNTVKDDQDMSKHDPKWPHE